MLFAGVGCTPDEEGLDLTPPTLSLAQTALGVTHEGGSVSTTVESNCSWKATCDVEGITLTRESGTLTIDVPAYESDRFIAVTVTASKIVAGKEVSVTKMLKLFQNANGDYVENAIIDITKEGTYTVDRAWVVASYENGVLLTDLTGKYILVYLGKKETLPEIGAVVKVSGDVTTYGGLLQFSAGTNIEPVPGAAAVAVVHGTAEVIDYAKASTYVKEPYITYATMTGKLSVNGSYYDLLFDEANDVQGSVSYPASSIAEQLVGLNNAYVIVTGYMIGATSGKYANMMAITVEGDASRPVLFAANIAGVDAAGVTNETCAITAVGLQDVNVTCDGTVVTSATLDGSTLTYSVSANSGAERVGSITITPSNVESVTITVTQNGASPQELPYVETFNENAGAFTIDDVETGSYDYIWSHKTYNGAGYMYATCKKGEASKAWLISPAINLGTATNPELSFEHAHRNVKTPSDDITLWVKENNVEDAQWTQLEIPNFSDQSSWTFYNSGVISLKDYAGKTVRIAFKYVSHEDATAQYSPGWEIRNVKVGAFISAEDINGVAATGVTDDKTAIATQGLAEGATITATYDNTVVTDAKVQGAELVYTVSPNPNETWREGWIKLSAEGVEEYTIKVVQLPTDNSTYTKIDKIANLTAGDYYIAAYSEGYDKTDFKANPWHLCTGVSTDLYTTPYTYTSESKLVPAAGTTNLAITITVVAVEGKENTYYIKSGNKYLYSSVAATNRKLGLTDTATEWVASDHASGGIVLSSNEVNLGTANAGSSILRSYAKASSLKAGVFFFKKN